MMKKTEKELQLKLNKIKALMKIYHNCLNKSLSYRKIAETFNDDKKDFATFYNKMINAEIRCIEIDERINKLFNEYQTLKIQ